MDSSSRKPRGPEPQNPPAEMENEETLSANKPSLSYQPGKEIYVRPRRQTKEEDPDSEAAMLKKKCADCLGTHPRHALNCPWRAKTTKNDRVFVRESRNGSITCHYKVKKDSGSGYEWKKYEVPDGEDDGMDIDEEPKPEDILKRKDSGADDDDDFEVVDSVKRFRAAPGAQHFPEVPGIQRTWVDIVPRRNPAPVNGRGIVSFREKMVDEDEDESTGWTML